MKLNFFKFQDGKVFWLPNYPSKELPLYQFLDLEAQSLASAIEVAQEDEGRIKNLVIGVEFRQVAKYGIQNGKVYSAECEMERGERKQQHLCKACKVDCIAALGKGACKAPLIKVARLKSK